MLSIQLMHQFLKARLQYKRAMCLASNQMLDVKINDNSGVATVTMRRRPVNCLNLDFLQEFNKTLNYLSANQINGMILTSDLPHVFSAGLDINEVIKPSRERLDIFFRSLQDVWINLYGSKFTTVAAITGHAPAGGCMLSLCCEYRVMVDGKYTIGLNETALGIVVMPWLIATMKNTISLRQAELALTASRMFNASEALKIGLIDDIASDNKDCMKKAEKFLESLDKISHSARVQTKLLLRSSFIRHLEVNRNEDINLFIDNITEDDQQKHLANYLQSLKLKSSR